MSVMAIVARSPPPSASTSPIQVSSGTVATSARQRGTTSQLTGLKPIDRERVDFLRHLHRGQLRRQARARAARHDDGGDQGPELAELCDDDELGNVHHRAEPSELRDAEKSDDEPDEQVRGARDRQCVRADSPASAAATMPNRPSEGTAKALGTAAAQ